MARVARAVDGRRMLPDTAEAVSPGSAGDRQVRRRSRNGRKSASADSDVFRPSFWPPGREKGSVPPKRRRAPAARDVTAHVTKPALLVVRWAPDDGQPDGLRVDHPLARRRTPIARYPGVETVDGSDPLSERALRDITRRRGWSEQRTAYRAGRAATPFPGRRLR